MKLLFDQNVSPKLPHALSDLYPGSQHVFNIALDQSSDQEIWTYAKVHRYGLVTRDADFSDLCMLYGFPPTVIWIRRGNCSTATIAAILRDYHDLILESDRSGETGVLTLY